VGEGFDQGRGTAAFQSKVSVLNLGHRSGKLPRCVLPVATTCVFNATTRAADLHYVGAGAAPGSSGSRAEGALWFGVSTFGNWATLRGATTPIVDIDVDGDGEFDYVVAAVTAAGTDLLLSVLFDSAGRALSYYPVNFLEGDVDTNVFDANTVLLPVSPADIGLTDDKSSFPIRYQVSTSSPYAADDGAFDTTPWIDFDVAAPAIQVASPLYLDADDTTIPYTVSPPAQAAASGGSAALTSTRVDAVQALLLHLHGESGERAEAVTLPR
jgi:hypothetical protein